MPLVATSSDGCDVHSVSAHMLDRRLHQPRRSAAMLVINVDGNDVHDTHSLMERVERNGGKPHRTPMGNRDEDIPVIARTGRPHRFRLNGTRLWPMEAREDRPIGNPRQFGRQTLSNLQASSNCLRTDQSLVEVCRDLLKVDAAEEGMPRARRSECHPPTTSIPNRYHRPGETHARSASLEVRYRPLLVNVCLPSEIALERDDDHVLSLLAEMRDLIHGHPTPRVVAFLTIPPPDQGRVRECDAPCHCNPHGYHPADREYPPDASVSRGHLLPFFLRPSA